jgi:four helix bundle protein
MCNLLLLLFTLLLILINLEGYGRKSKNEYIQFLHIALGSLRELDTQLIIAKEVKLTTAESFEPVLEEVDRMQGILVSTIQKLKS